MSVLRDLNYANQPGQWLSLAQTRSREAIPLANLSGWLGSEFEERDGMVAEFQSWPAFSIAPFPYGTIFVAPVWESRPRLGGVASWKHIIGQSLDVNGNPLGTCVCKLYFTADGYSGAGSKDTVWQTKTSDANGNFQFDVPSSDQFYIVAYKAGSPDVEGTTVNTLTGV